MHLNSRIIGFLCQVPRFEVVGELSSKSSEKWDGFENRFSCPWPWCHCKAIGSTQQEALSKPPVTFGSGFVNAMMGVRVIAIPSRKPRLSGRNAINL